MKPIICNSESVRAILDGKQTQVRRVIKPQPPEHCGEPFFDSSGYGFFFDGLDSDGNCMDVWPDGDLGIDCPYGIPGDKLWVKETWQAIDDIYIGGSDHAGHYVPDDEPDRRDIPDRIKNIIQETAEIFYKADNVSTISHWRPSIHMPRWASRIILEIKDVRVERVQDITDRDIKAEGIESLSWLDEAVKNLMTVGVKEKHMPNWIFHELWDSINAKPKPTYYDKKILHYTSYPFDGEKETGIHRRKPWYILPNPFVFVLEFEKCSS